MLREVHQILFELITVEDKYPSSQATHFNKPDNIQKETACYIQAQGAINRNKPQLQYFQMQSLRHLNIFHLYRRLPYIIFNEDFLFPQRPFPAKPSLKDTFTTNSLVKTASKKLDSKKYQNELTAYVKKYIVPTMITPSSLKLRLYLKDHGKDVIEPEGIKVRDLQPDLLKQYFSLLPKQEQQLYYETAKEKYQKYLQAFELNYRIPKFIDLSPEQLYRVSQENSRRKKAIKFSTLSTAQKAKYRSQSKELKAHNQKRMQDFLGQHKLSAEEFEMIKQISEQAKQCAELCKEALKSRKSKKGEDYQGLAIESLKLKGLYLSEMTEEQYERYARIFGKWQARFGKIKDGSQSSQPKAYEQKQASIQPLKKKQAVQQGKKSSSASKTKKKSTKSKPQVKQMQLVSNATDQKTSTQSNKIEPIEVTTITIKEAAKADSPDAISTQKVQEVKSSPSLEQKITESPVGEAFLELSDKILSEQLKEQDLNDLSILDEDQQVIKLKKVIKKAGKSMPKKPIN